MPLETPARPRTPQVSELALPPPFSARDACARWVTPSRMQTIAAEEGAGTLVYVGRFDLAEFAVVLEPEEPLR